MTTYAVGDVQGCLQTLKKLLKKVKFDPAKDQLWSVGDLVNRGPESLATLRYCYDLGNSFRMVLGNHDLHLLAIARGVRDPTKNDTFYDVLKASDSRALLDWLQQQPLLFEAADYLVVHAGIPPMWGRSKAKKLADEVHTILQDGRASDFFQQMYGNKPANWSDNLEGTERWRTITNYLTRMRFCKSNGKLDFKAKTTPDKPPKNYLPWYAHPERKTRDQKIIFGHWAALEGKYCGDNLYPLDTGCVWGGPMRLMNIETGEYIHQEKI